MNTALNRIQGKFLALASSFDETASQLESEFRAIKSRSAFLKSEHATRFIVHWLYSYTHFQKKLGKGFNREVSHAASDEFTAAMAFTLEAFMRSRGIKGLVHSEHKIPGIKKMRPDVLVKSAKDEVIAVIECKTQLGWNRKGWKRQQGNRERRIQKVYPNAIVALCVHRRTNWVNGWDKFDDAVVEGRKWYTLVHTEPGSTDECQVEIDLNKTEHPRNALKEIWPRNHSLEDLFWEIMRNSK